MSSMNHANSKGLKTAKKPNANPSTRPSRPSPNTSTKSSREHTSNNQRPALTPTKSTTATVPRTNYSSLGPLAVSTNRENVPLNPSPAAHSHVYRDSLFSLKDDPFFRNYTTAQSEVLAAALRPMSIATDLGGDAVIQPLSFNMAAAGTAEDSVTGMGVNDGNDINIAIIGAEGAGKSTFIQRALGLPKPPTSVASSLRMNIDSATYTISLVELDLEAFDITSDRRILWPKQINGVIVPRFDGALILYDVMNRESISDLPQTLNALTQSSIPSIIVATKCENPPNTRQIDTDKMEALCSACVESRQTSANKTESARNALSAMLRAILSHRNKGEIYGRRRAASSVPTPISQQNTHNRASSDISLLKGFPTPPQIQSSVPSSLQPHGRTAISHQAPVLEAPPLSDHPAFRNETLAEIFSVGSTSKDFLLDTDESDADSAYKEQEDVPILQRNEEIFMKPSTIEKVVGVTFDDLVDRLLSQHMSRHDTNFQDIFLCLYRKFTAPGELFSAIVQRFQQAAEDKSVHQLIRATTQLRILNVLSKWIDNYPGDFASPQTSYRLDSFVTSLSRDPAFGASANELRFQLDNRVMVDDDTGWACCDPDAKGLEETLRVSIPGNSDEFSSKLETLTVNSDGDTDSFSHHPSGVPSTSTNAASLEDLLPPSTTYHTFEDYEREAQILVPRPIHFLNKIRYHIFMDTPDDDFAEEMTRMDWVMFSSIRIRDLVRHVSLSLNNKEKCRSLANVNRMISHFNHIAKWVSLMILVRDKAKHRALVLEKFMRIALSLRILNNYNGLGAVIAGINGTAIHRLGQTRALVSQEVAKRFMRLELLMGNQKSYFAYRLAWENSSMPRIPFVPLHRRDLVSAEEGSKTFVGGEGTGGVSGGQRINWRKFEVLGEVVLPVLRSQVVGFGNLRRREVARESVLDCKMPSDEEEIYQRSLAVESLSSTASGDFSKKKFPWFQK